MVKQVQSIASIVQLYPAKWTYTKERTSDQMQYPHLEEFLSVAVVNASPHLLYHVGYTFMDLTRSTKTTVPAHERHSDVIDSSSTTEFSE